MKEVPAARNLSLRLALSPARALPLLMLMGAVLAACGSTVSGPALAEADRNAQAAFTDCNNQLRSGKIRSYRLMVECAAPRVTQAYQMAGYPFTDLVNLDLAAWRLGADRIDAGLVPPADVYRDLGELDHRILVERERRMAGRRGGGIGADPTPPEQMLAGLNTLTGRTVPPPTNGNGNCFKVGTFTHCD
jgi:hypothetical protein